VDRSKIALIASVALFVIACRLPALDLRNTGRGPSVMSGLEALGIGWSGIFGGVFAWYANPFWLAGLIAALLRKPIHAEVLGGIAILLGATTFLLIGRELLGDEGGVTKTTIVRILPGCYVWLASLATPLISGLLSRLA
jgi:hypothetical protein